MEKREGLPRLLQLFPKDHSIGNTTIDIVAVHGIETHSPNTWTAYERDSEPRGRRTYWLCDEDMLPEVVPQARIWAYDYNSSCYSDNAPEVDILALGDTLLEILRGARDKGVGKRTIIFIGSCFGGILIAQALVRAFRDRARYEDLLRWTAGVVFLGTPLRGTPAASLTQWLVWIRGWMGWETSHSLIDSLKEKDNDLNNMVHDFVGIANNEKIQLRCFYETLETQIAKAVMSSMLAKLFPTFRLVPKESASLDGHKRFALNVNHRMMNKFRNPDDGSFKLVSSSLKELADNVVISQPFTEEESKCLEGLASRYQEDKNRIEKRVQNTCMWVLEHPKYLHWQESTASLLWISADPGCGKSVLSRALVDEGLLKSSVSVCYFFFKDDDPSRQDAAKAICAILHQLLVQKPALLPYVMRHFRTHRAKLFTMFSMLWDLLEEAAADPQAGEIICVLDALDECREQARELIQQLSRFYSSPNKLQTRLKFLVTSRPYVDIERAFHSTIEDIASINLRGEEESEKISNEIDLVIRVRVPQICRARRPRISPEVEEALISRLSKFKNRTYLWLYFIFDVIQRSLDSTKFRLERLVNTLPRSVADAYEKMLGRIDEEQVQEATCLLHIVVAAVEPLTLREMNIALAINGNLEYGEPCQSYHNLELQSEEAFQEKIRTLCGLFVIIVDSKVYLIHQTAKEFLISTRFNDTPAVFAQRTSRVWKHSLAPVESNLVILKICLSLLLLLSRTDGYPCWNVTREGLQVYAALNWAKHFRRAKTRINESVLQSTVAVCEPQCSRFWSYWQNKTSLMVGVQERLETVVEFLLEKRSIDLNVQDGSGKTALHLAAQPGYDEIVKILVEKNDIDLNIQDKAGKTALFLAVESQYKENEYREESLQSTAQCITYKQYRHRKRALYSAAQLEHFETIKILVEKKDIDLNIQDIYGETVLFWAVQLQNHDIIQLLIDKPGIDLNVQDTCLGGTALHLAALRGYYETIKPLVEKKSLNLNIQDETKSTALHFALLSENYEMSKLLIEKRDIDLNIQGGYEQTALHLAVHFKNHDIVQLLVDKKGIDLNIRDKNRKTALHLAAKIGYHETVKTLVEKKDIDLNLKDRFGQTPLHLAAKFGYSEVVKVLIDKKGIDLNIQSSSGLTALHLAARIGCDELIKTLVEKKDIDLNLKDRFGRTPLHLAAKYGNSEVAEVLINKKGIGLNLKDRFDKTPLHLAAKYGNSEVAEVLIDHDGIELALKDRSGQTPLMMTILNAPLKYKLSEIGHLRYEDLRGGYLKDSLSKRDHLGVIELFLSKAPGKTLEQCIDNSNLV